MDTLDALKLFVSISETGSMSAAARQQAVAVSTVASALQQLEEVTGVTLITRTTRRLSFTHEGLQFLSDAKRMLAGWDDALDAVQPSQVLNGPIRLTATNDLGRRLIAPAIDEFMKVHPRVRVSLHLSDGVVDLVESNLDVAIRNGPLADSSLRSRLLRPGHRIICASPAYWRAHGKPAHPDDLAQHNCLILQRPGVSYATWPFLVDGNLTAVRVSGDRSANDGSVLRHWALSGYGIMIKNKWEVREEIEAGTLEVALEEFSGREVNLYAVTPDLPNRRVSALIDFLADSLGSPDS